MRLPSTVLLVGALMLPASPAVQAQRLPPAYALPPMDQELFAGVSYRDAAVGTLILAGSALLAGAWMRSFLATTTAAVAAGGTYLIYEPSYSNRRSKIAVPTTQELRRDTGRD